MKGLYRSVVEAEAALASKDALIASLRERIKKLEKELLSVDFLDMGGCYELSLKDGERLVALQDEIAREANRAALGEVEREG